MSMTDRQYAAAKRQRLEDLEVLALIREREEALIREAFERGDLYTVHFTEHGARRLQVFFTLEDAVAWADPQDASVDIEVIVGPHGEHYLADGSSVMA